jgi:TldD protein
VILIKKIWLIFFFFLISCSSIPKNTSGKFVFNCTEAYEIVNGKIGSPIKGATLIGDGPSILKEVSMVGNDMMMDPGIGTCGKAGQGVPVGVAQPSILIDKMTVGGTKL